MAVQACLFSVNDQQQELRPHGTPDFPCAAYLHSHRQGTCDWHWHGELEILFQQAGQTDLSIPGSQYALAPGDCIAVNSNVLHRVESRPDSLLQSLVFSPALVAGSEESVFYQKYLLPLVSDSCARCIPLGPEGAEHFQAAFSALSLEEEGYEFSVREGLSRLCLMLYRQLGRRDGPYPHRLSVDTQRVRAVMTFIRTHYDQPLTLDQLAGAASISTRECHRCFRRALGQSPMQYLIQYRVTQGAALLAHRPGLSVAQVAARCGFDSPSHFSQTFKRFYQLSPREYRTSTRP